MGLKKMSAQKRAMSIILSGITACTAIFSGLNGSLHEKVEAYASYEIEDVVPDTTSYISENFNDQIAEYAEAVSTEELEGIEKSYYK